MVEIPSNKNTTKWLLNNTPFKTPKEITIPKDDFIRDYSGLSGIGNKCLRALQYYTKRANGSKVIEPRIHRIFDMGHILEAYMVLQLENIGIKVTHRQQTVEGFAGHWKGHIDGLGEGVPEAPKTPHLLEFKTHNLKNFNELCKVKVANSHPGHYAQMMRYMHGLELKRGLYIAYCKDNSHYYCERIYYSERQAEDLVHKEREVLLNPRLFPRIGNNKSNWYECKFCDHNQICYGKSEIKVNCRTCARVDMENDGVWKCTLDNKNLNYQEQMAACKMYQKDDMFK